jgi:rhodanese-related sulfurtransferase
MSAVQRIAKTPRVALMAEVMSSVGSFFTICRIGNRMQKVLDFYSLARTFTEQWVRGTFGAWQCGGRDGAGSDRDPDGSRRCF